MNDYYQTFYSPEPAGRRKEQLIAACLQQEQGRRGRRLRILDVGCGNGHLSAFMAFLGHEVTALDTASEAIALASATYANSSVRFKAGGIETALDQFDVVTAFEVCEHVANVHQFVHDLGGRLAPGGLLLVSVPNGWSLEEMARRFMQHTRIGAVLRRWLRASGRLPKCDFQTVADSPHLHFWQYRAWRRLFAGAGLALEASASVSLFFKQLYYMGGRRLLQPGTPIFQALDKFDGILVRGLPRFLADGWLMAWRKL